MRFLVLCAVALTFATQAHAWRDNYRNIIPIEVVKACAAQVGEAPPFYLEYPRIEGIITTQMLPGLGVSEAEANAINDCIQYWSGLPVRGPEITQSSKILGLNLKLQLSRTRCPSVMTGGDAYCIKRAWH